MTGACMKPLTTDDACPQWWRDGTPVDMQTTDLIVAEMLEGEEWDREWRLCLVPASLFDECFSTPGFMPLWHDHAESVRRFADIREWIGKRSVRDALWTQPVLAVLESTHLHVLDGWHRTTLAMTGGATGIPCVISMGGSLTKTVS